MNSQPHNRKSRKAARFLTEHATLVLIVVFLLGLFFVYLQVVRDPEHGSIGFVLLGHLGMALLIAALLGLTIEQFTRARHDQHRDDLVEALNQNREETIADLQRHVLRAVYRRTLPDELIDSAEAEIFQAAFLRSNWEVAFELSRLKNDAEAEEKVVRLKTTFSYDVQNVSKTNRELVIPVVIEMTSSHYDAALCGLRFVEIDGARLTKEEIVAITDQSDPTATACRLNIRRQMEASASLSVKLEYEQLHTDESVEFLCTRLPSKSMRITAVTPEKDFDLQLVSLHHAEPVASHDGPALWAWTLGPALFPGQGVALIWRPIRNLVGLAAG